MRHPTSRAASMLIAFNKPYGVLRSVNCVSTP